MTSATATARTALGEKWSRTLMWVRDKPRPGRRAALTIWTVLLAMLCLTIAFRDVSPPLADGGYYLAYIDRLTKVLQGQMALRDAITAERSYVYELPVAMFSVIVGISNFKLHLVVYIALFAWTLMPLFHWLLSLCGISSRAAYFIPLLLLADPTIPVLASRWAFGEVPALAFGLASWCCFLAANRSLDGRSDPRDGRHWVSRAWAATSGLLAVLCVLASPSFLPVLAAWYAVNVVRMVRVRVFRGDVLLSGVVGAVGVFLVLLFPGETIIAIERQVWIWTHRAETMWRFGNDGIRLDDPAYHALLPLNIAFWLCILFGAWLLMSAIRRDWRSIFAPAASLVGAIAFVTVSVADHNPRYGVGVILVLLLGVAAGSAWASRRFRMFTAGLVTAAIVLSWPWFLSETTSRSPAMSVRDAVLSPVGWARDSYLSGNYFFSQGYSGNWEVPYAHVLQAATRVDQSPTIWVLTAPSGVLPGVAVPGVLEVNAPSSAAYQDLFRRVSVTPVNLTAQTAANPSLYREFTRHSVVAQADHIIVERDAAFPAWQFEAIAHEAITDDPESFGLDLVTRAMARRLTAGPPQAMAFELYSVADRDMYVEAVTDLLRSYWGDAAPSTDACLWTMPTGEDIVPVAVDPVSYGTSARLIRGEDGSVSLVADIMVRPIDYERILIRLMGPDGRSIALDQPGCYTGEAIAVAIEDSVLVDSITRGGWEVRVGVPTPSGPSFRAPTEWEPSAEVSRVPLRVEPGTWSDHATLITLDDGRSFVELHLRADASRFPKIYVHLVGPTQADFRTLDHPSPGSGGRSAVIVQDPKVAQLLADGFYLMRVGVELPDGDEFAFQP